LPRAFARSDHVTPPAGTLHTHTHTFSLTLPPGFRPTELAPPLIPATLFLPWNALERLFFCLSPISIVETYGYADLLVFLPLLITRSPSARTRRFGSFPFSPHNKSSPGATTVSTIRTQSNDVKSRWIRDGLGLPTLSLSACVLLWTNESHPVTKGSPREGEKNTQERVVSDCSNCRRKIRPRRSHHPSSNCRRQQLRR
jgi:hypothetical protein